MKSAEFRKLYVPEVKLIPPYNKNNQTRSVQDKIMQCIMIQEQFCAQVMVGDLELSNIDYPIKSQNGATLRELILRFQTKEKKPMFVGVERRWNNQGFQIFLPQVYKDEAMEYIKHLPFYLVRTYGKN